MDFISLAGDCGWTLHGCFCRQPDQRRCYQKGKSPLCPADGGLFRFVQAFMPFVGWLVGTAGASFISSIDHWVALILLVIIGGQMVRESSPTTRKAVSRNPGCHQFENAAGYGRGHQY